MNGNPPLADCGVHGRELILHLDPEKTDKTLAEPHTRIFDLSGRPMKGWILVKSAGLSDDKALAKWIRIGMDFASSLPKK